MKKEHFFGFFLGILASFVGTYLYVASFTKFNLLTDYGILNLFGLVGKVITLGSLLTVALFLYFFYTKKEAWSNGVLAALLFLLILTFFI